jgi:hypothetical protein
MKESTFGKRKVLPQRQQSFEEIYPSSSSSCRSSTVSSSSNDSSNSEPLVEELGDEIRWKVTVMWADVPDTYRVYAKSYTTIMNGEYMTIVFYDANNHEVARIQKVLFVRKERL